MTKKEWTWSALGELTQRMQYGLSVRGGVEGRYPILRMNCQQDGRVLFRDLQYVDLDANTARAYQVHPGDILFNRTNSYELVGRTAIAEVESEAVFASYLLRIVLDKSQVDPHFINFFLNWQVTQQELKKLAGRGVSQANISAENLRSLLVPVPLIDEQRSIAALLKLVRRAIELQDSCTTIARELKSAVTRRLFTRGLRGEAQKETDVRPFPESWSTEPLGVHHSVVSGGTPSRSNPAYWIGGTIPWVKTTEIDYCVVRNTEERITSAGLNESAAKLLPVGTVLLAMYGQGVTRGKVALLGIEAACNQACAAIRPSDAIIDPRYLYHFLSYRYEEIRQLAHGGQQQNLNLDIVRELPIAFPTEKGEQQEIVAILDALDRKIDIHRKKRGVLEDLFRALLHKLMAGEIRVSDLDLSAVVPKQAVEVNA
jgi:type I restriction enzyme S subunit